MCSVDTFSFSKYMDIDAYKKASNAVVFQNSRVFEDDSAIHFRTSFMRLEYDNLDVSYKTTVSMVSYKGGVVAGVEIPRLIEDRIIFVISKTRPSLVIVSDSEIFRNEIIPTNLTNSNNCHVEAFLDIIINQLNYNLIHINEVVRIMYTVKMNIENTTFYTSQALLVVVDKMNKIIWLYQTMIQRIKLMVSQVKNDLAVRGGDAGGRYSTISSLMTECNELLLRLNDSTFFVTEAVIMRAELRNNMTLRALTIVSFVFLPASFLISYITFYRDNQREGSNNVSIIILSIIMIATGAFFKEDFIQFFKDIAV